MKRRGFIKVAGIGATALSMPNILASSFVGDKKPNVLFVFTDQHTLNAMSATGNPHLKTPALDKLAANGVTFTNSYCTSPVCGPARSSLLTGRMPHETGVDFNEQAPHSDIPNMGQVFREAGYKTLWAGKWHLPESYPSREGKSNKIAGFDIIPFYDPKKKNRHWVFGWNTDEALADAVVDVVKNKIPKEPFLLGVSFHNPHDICFYVRNKIFFTRLNEIENLPPLPENNGVDENEPELVKLLRTKDNYGFETARAKDFTDEEWQGYLYDYYRLVEMVDVEVGKILDAFEEEGLMDDTIIVFTADHGDGAASHKWHSKVVLYEESVAVPFIISYKGKISKNIIDDKHLVSGVDVLPTLCDYAGIKHPKKCTGKSLKPILDDPSLQGTEFVITELAPFLKSTLGGKYFDWRGRMVRTSEFKYCVYSNGERNEQLFDMVNDRGEMNNLAYNSKFRSVIKKHRNLLVQWIKDTDDDFKMPIFN